jgi:hypothetical protein
VNRDLSKLVAEVDLEKNATYIVKDGQLILVTSPPNGYGKQVIAWQSGKVSHYELNSTHKL